MNKLGVGAIDEKFLWENSGRFCWNFYAKPENWIHYYTPETNEKCYEWGVSAESAPKRSFSRKKYWQLFWDCNILRLFEETYKVHMCTLCILIGSIQNLIEGEKFMIRSHTKPFPTQQRTSPFICSNGREINGVRLYTCSTSYLLIQHPRTYYLNQNMKKSLSGKWLNLNDDVNAEAHAQFSNKKLEQV